MAALLLGSACAARLPPAAGPTAEVLTLARADTLLRRGCYACLEEARSLLQPLAGEYPAARAAAFDVAVLLAVKDRELGIVDEDHLALARGLDPGGERSALVLAVAGATPWPMAASGPAARDLALTTAHGLSETVPAWHAALDAHAAAGDLVARYLAVGLECSWPSVLPSALPADAPPGSRREATEDEAPLIAIRRLWGANPALDDVVAARSRNPRYEELDMLAGQVALAGGALLTAERHLQAVYARFPAMLSAAHGLARLHVMLEEYEASLPEYDAVLARVADQQDCLLGKARALSQLGRYAEARPLLDRLIELGTWLVADAHYWRGWNRLHEGDVDGAGADVEQALALMSNARVHVLAGSVAARRLDWGRAGREFEAAQALDETDCDIPVSLGAVRGQQRDWAAAAGIYARASSCLVEAQDQMTRRVAEIVSAPMSEARRERFLARTRAASDAMHRQEGQSRYNAAVSLANQGRLEEARPWAQQAATWPEWKERALELLERGRR